ncbi:MAG: pyrimidine reductase family protein, partial [Mycobacterium sp.]|nr:pyrimidine reductase family protein [Mycobacterium sp.]
ARGGISAPTFDPDVENSCLWVDLGRRYAYPEIAPSGRRCYVRANMICSLDGAATRDGRSAGLGARGDNAVFGALRGLCDVVVVGARTVATEDYGALSANDEFLGWRGRRRQRSVPAVAVVSASLDLDPEARVFATPMAMVFTSRAAPRARREQLTAGGVKVISCGDDDVDMHLAFEFLSGMGLWRVLVEGGPTLLGNLTDADLIDELCLTVSPTVLGGRGPRIVSSLGDAAVGMRPVHVLADADNYLYTRWVRHPRVAGERPEPVFARSAS